MTNAIEMIADSNLDAVNGGLSLGTWIGAGVGILAAGALTVASGGALAPLAADLGVSITAGVLGSGAATAAGGAAVGGIIGGAANTAITGEPMTGKA